MGKGRQSRRMVRVPLLDCVAGIVIVLSWLVAFSVAGFPAGAAQTDDRTKPVYDWGPTAPPLMSFHLPSALVEGGRFLRLISFPGLTDEPTAPTTYLIETNADGRPATIRFEATVSQLVGKKVRSKLISGERELQADELKAVRAALAKVRICLAAAEGPVVFDGGGVSVEFADGSRYCFAERDSPADTAPEFAELSKVVTGLVKIHADE